MRSDDVRAVRRADDDAGRRDEGGADDPASLEADDRTERIERVVVLYAQITAATREFLAAVAECDRHRDWAASGFGSCAEWLGWRLGIGRNAANERVRMARALEDLPRTSEAMGRGELSFSKVRALTRVASVDNEGELLELARSASAAHLERVVRAYRTLDRDDEARRERLLHRTRRFSVVPDGEGMYVVRGRLMPEVAALLMRAVDAAGDALYAGSTEEDRDEVEPAQRRADAVGLLAERALAAGFGSSSGRENRAPDELAGDVGRELAPEVDDRCGGDPGSEGAIPISGSTAERFQVMLHLAPETLAESGEPGMSELEDGTRVSAETARRLACDASVVEVVGARPGPEPVRPQLGRRSRILNVGRRTRTVPAPLRRALEARDRGCRFPGCGRRFTDAHHIVHWADGGETKLSNLVLLCGPHHRRVHEDGWRVCSDISGTRVVFFTPEGRALAEAPPLNVRRGSPLSGHDAGSRAASSGHEGIVGGARPEVHYDNADRPAPPFEKLLRRLAERGVDPDWMTNLPRYRCDEDIPWTIEAAAREALDGGEPQSDAA